MSAFNPRHRDTLAGQISIALYRISQAMGFLLRERGLQLDLTPAQIQALLFLKYARPGVRTIGGLSERLKVAYATSSSVADALERKGLLKRSVVPEDLRVVKLALTPAGEERVAQVEGVLDVIEAAVNHLPEEEQSSLAHALKIIVRELHGAGYVRVYEMCRGCQFFRKDAHPENPQEPHHCAFMDAPLREADTYLECPEFAPANE
ncbi:MAG: MarR family winged helix-turn-helix transcriptional regulator [Firmicutes bacterium]|nr:MarR family winged helix-turn-helix transcriptional regulator [Bacillota bacterium]